MLKISTIEARNQRRLLVEGKLVSPWTSELKRACDEASADLDGRELVVDVKNLTAINQEGENLLVELMNEGVKVRCCGLFAKYVLRQLVRRVRQRGTEEKQ